MDDTSGASTEARPHLLRDAITEAAGAASIYCGIIADYAYLGDVEGLSHATQRFIGQARMIASLHNSIVQSAERRADDDAG